MKKFIQKFFFASYYLIINYKNVVMRQTCTGTKLWPGFLALPAGHVDEGENVYEAFVREAKEELGIEVSKNDIINTFVTNRKNKSLSSYFDVYFEINHYEGDIKIMEPNKCKELVWFNINNLPFDMIDFEKRAIENYLDNIFFYCDYANNEITIEDIKK